MTKRVSLLTLLACSRVFAADYPVKLSVVQQYANYVVESNSEVYARLARQKKSFDATADIFYSDDYTLVNAPLTYVYENRFGISVILPYVKNDAGVESESGTGDITAEISWNAGSLLEEDNNVFALRYVASTGDEEKGLGRGAQAMGISWSSYTRSDEWLYTAGLLFVFYLEDLDNGVKPGGEDTIWFGIGHRCLLNDKIDTQLKVNWQTAFEDETPDGDRLPGTSYDLVDATLQWSSERLVEGASFKAGVRIPVWISNRDVDAQFMFFVGAAGLF